MCENKCCYVNNGCSGDCSCGTVTTCSSAGKEYEYIVEPNIQGEPVTISSQCNVDPTLAWGKNTKVILNGKPLPWVLDFNCSKLSEGGEFTCFLGEIILQEEIEDGSEFKIITTIGEKEIVLFKEKIVVYDRIYSCNSNENFVKVTIMFVKV